MKLKNTNPLLSLFVVTALMAVQLPAMALKGDTEQPININSLQQSLEMESNTVTFTGDVAITQGSIKVNADKVLVIRPQGENGKEVIEAYGNPVSFSQMQDNGKPIKGHGQKLRYELDKEFVVLTGNAYLEQLDSNVKGDKITYLVKEQKMEAFSEKGKKVSTTLLPTQLQNKNLQTSNDKKSQ